MNEEQNDQEAPRVDSMDESIPVETTWKKSLCTATPFSKFLASVLFVVLPFIGFFLGFLYSSPDNTVNTATKVLTENEVGSNESKEQELDSKNNNENKFIKQTLIDKPDESLEVLLEPYAYIAGISTDGERVYLIQEQEEGVIDYYILEDLDPTSLDIISRTILRDDLHVYSFYNMPYEQGRGDMTKLQIIENADPGTFELLETCISVEKSRALFARDKQNVFVETKILEGIDPATFERLEFVSNEVGMYSVYALAKDKNHLYVGCGAVVEGVDPQSFVHIGQNYIADKNGVYYLFFSGFSGVEGTASIKKIVGVDVATFEYVWGGYAKDKENVYYGEVSKKKVTVLQGANPQKFEVFIYPNMAVIVAKDDKHVYERGVLIPNTNSQDCSVETAASGGCNASGIQASDRDLYNGLYLVKEESIENVSPDVGIQE